MAKNIEQLARRNGLSVEVEREDFALQLKTWRIRNGKTQNDVAREWNISRSSVQRVEAAKPIAWQMAYRVFTKLAAALASEGLTLPDYLYSGNMPTKKEL